MPMQEWPEGPYADPEKARERYRQDLAQDRAALREVLRADNKDAHLGVVIVLIAAGMAAWIGGPVVAASIGAAFAGLYVLTLAVMLLRGIRGGDAFGRSYRFTFGWSQWF
ncbi:hypothetical protein [Yinghuangia soli]|uniref:Uncharacterized protein n=1 Tax=Yinghuangia soli TaxID=2908204 RepID=A0AA41Q796_9ACTN|nr:hypothetical protein [Yinghuangia soli]MCF2532511.1 hypothetical protein [Yinghuangia soli]